jgi:hypothetical protein
MKRKHALLAVLIIFALVATVLVAQTQGPAGKRILGQNQGFARGAAMARMQPDGSWIVKRLNRSLKLANGAELSDDQIEAIKQLVAATLQDRPQPTDPSGLPLLQGYGDAILAGDKAEAESLAQQIAARTAAKAETRLIHRAVFAIDLLNILDPESQIEPLSEEIGNRGLLRLVSPGGGRQGRMERGSGFRR